MVKQAWRSARGDVNSQPTVKGDSFRMIYFKTRSAHKLDCKRLKGRSSRKRTQASLKRFDLHGATRYQLQLTNAISFVRMLAIAG